MKIQIIIFGQLTDIFNCDAFTVTNIADTDSLVKELNTRYPALGDAKYIIAVDKQKVSSNTILKEGSTVALMPPFSGG